MQNNSQLNTLKSDLLPAWIFQGMLLTLLIIMIAVCHSISADQKLGIPESQRIIIRTVLYVVTITVMPLTNLLRFIMVRLNQTMPGVTSAKRRYFITVVISLLLVECIGLFGLVMFMLGDDFNTLYIFSVVAVLGMYVYRPKQDEYQSIVSALANGQN